jgi:hypothetical protein
MRTIFAATASLFLGLLLFVRTAGAITVGQTDTFQDGTLMGWSTGPFAPPIENLDGGPAGVGDRYIRMTADGGGAGGRLTIFNDAPSGQWSGNYIMAGVTTIQIDLNNQSAVSLSIRLAFKSEISQVSPGYLTAPMLLPANSGWIHFSVSVTAASLIAVGGPTAYNTFFTDVQEMRIIHEVGTSNLNGDNVVGMLGIDNIHAVPEPATIALTSGGLLLLAARLLRRGRCAASAR